MGLDTVENRSGQWNRYLFDLKGFFVEIFEYLFQQLTLIFDVKEKKRIRFTFN